MAPIARTVGIWENRDRARVATDAVCRDVGSIVYERAIGVWCWGFRVQAGRHVKCQEEGERVCVSVDGLLSPSVTVLVLCDV